MAGWMEGKGYGGRGQEITRLLVIFDGNCFDFLLTLSLALLAPHIAILSVLRIAKIDQSIRETHTPFSMVNIPYEKHGERERHTPFS